MRLDHGTYSMANKTINGSADRLTARRVGTSTVSNSRRVFLQNLFAWCAVGTPIALRASQSNSLKALSNAHILDGFLSVKEPRFGAKGDGTTDDTAAFQAAIDEAIDRTKVGSGYGATILVPNGDYKLRAPLSIRIPNKLVTSLRFQGEGGYPGGSETRLKWQPGRSIIGLTLSSVQQCEFNDIEFVCGNSNISTLINSEAEQKPVFSSFQLSFNRCSFRTFSGVNPSTRMMRLVNTVLVEFNKCWFSGDNNSMLLGESVANSEGGGGIGAALFNQCQVYWNIEVGNVTTGLTFLNTIFARVNPTTPVTIFPKTSGFVRQQHVTFIGCSQVSKTDGVEAIFWRQGKASEGLVALNNRFDGYKTTFLIDGNGYAVLDGNVYNPPDNVKGVIGIKIGTNATKIRIGSEDFTALLENGFIGIDDNRTSPRWPLIVDKALASDRTYSSVGNFETIISEKVQLEGGLYRITWAAAVVSAAAAAYNFRVTVNGEPVGKLVSRGGSLKSGESRQYGGSAIAAIDGTTSAVAIALLSRQSTGTGSVVKASDNTDYSTFLQIEKL